MINDWNDIAKLKEFCKSISGDMFIIGFKGTDMIFYYDGYSVRIIINNPSYFSRYFDKMMSAQFFRICRKYCKNPVKSPGEEIFEHILMKKKIEV